jgi:Heavy metal associated domain 2
LARQRLRHASLDADRSDLETEVAKVVPPFQILHSIPGRIRLHIPDWQNLERSALEHRLRAMSGVDAVRANPLTRNLLIYFDRPGDVERVLKLIDAVLRKCGESLTIPTVASLRALTPTPPGLRPISLRNASTRRVPTPRLLTHAPAILSLALSLVTCGSPLGLVRVALETLQLCAELSVPGQA